MTGQLVADGAALVEEEGAEVDEMGDVVTAVGCAGDHQPAVAVADEHLGPVEPVELVTNAAHVVEMAGEGQVDRDVIQPGPIELRGEVLPAPSTVPGAVDEYDRCHPRTVVRSAGIAETCSGGRVRHPGAMEPAE